MRATRQTITVANGQQDSSVWTPMKGCLFTMLLLPALDDGDVTLQLSMDSGSNFYTVLDIDGSALIICASGSDPGWVDVSDYIRAVPDDGDIQFRINAGINQTAGRTIQVLQRGVA